MPLTKKDQILLQLSRFDDVGFDRYEMPYGLTQDGIGVALGLSRAHVCIELKKLMEHNYVRWENAHIKNGRKMRKVYMLTGEGSERVGEILGIMEKEGIRMDGIFCDGTARLAKADARIGLAYKKVLEAAEILSALMDVRRPNTYPAMELLIDAVKNLASNNECNGPSRRS